MSPKRRASRGLLGMLPDPREIFGGIHGLVDKLSELKDVPKVLIDHVVEADKDFKEADKSLKGARIRGKKRG